jgi:uncharacterized Fe-S cluster-containing radical SAM superfamily protein
MKPLLSITHLNSGGVIANYHCVSRCGHCLYNCGPHRSKDYLDEALADRIFQRISALGCHSVHIGGGEPLLAPQKLITALNAARRNHMAIDYVETNCAWFVDHDQAAALLAQLQTAGLQTLLISISPFHNAHIPFARTLGVIDACRQSGMNVFPWVSAFVRDLSKLDQTRPHSMAEFQARFGEDYLQRIPDHYWIHMGGRALETFAEMYPQTPLDKILEDSPLSCARDLSDTRHFHIDLHGHYIPGLCSGLAVDMDDLGQPLPEGKYPLLDQLTATGIRGLYAWAHRTYNYEPRKKTFLNHCDVCTDIRSFLLQKNSDRFPELAPKGFYDELKGRKSS